MTARKPMLIDLDGAPAHDPGAAPPPPDDAAQDRPEGRAMQLAMRATSKQISPCSRLGWSALLGLLVMMLSVAAWDFVTNLLARVPALGIVASGLLFVVVIAVLALAGREIMGFRRLRKLDILRASAEAARQSETRTEALQVVASLQALYAARPEMRWPSERLAETLPDQLDAVAVLEQAEITLFTPLDAQARLEVEAAARQVALLTALIPLALIDVLAALLTSLRMIRRIAGVYGGRAGALGSLRLLRGVVAHLLATGAVAVGEDMVSAVASGSVVSKLSRRFGEGIVNGALTARLGIAAMEVCRPLPFDALPRPSTSRLMRRAASGLFDMSGKGEN